VDTAAAAGLIAAIAVVALDNNALQTDGNGEGGDGQKRLRREHGMLHVLDALIGLKLLALDCICSGEEG
jgi:hypothetical protein